MQLGDDMNYPDWNILAKIDLSTCCKLRSERFNTLLNDAWRNIISSSEHDNDEIESHWMYVCDHSRLIREEFLSFVAETRDENDCRPIDWKDVLRFFRKIAIDEEFESELDSYKY